MMPSLRSNTVAWYFVCLIAALSLTELAAPARATDFFWNSGTGGFTNPALWNPAGGPGGADDTVNFDRGIAPENRYVVFAVSGENERLLIHDDSLVMVVNGSYSLLSSSSSNPSFTLGVAAGDEANLRLLGEAGAGLLQTQHGSIGHAAGSTGVVSVDNLTWNNSGNLAVGAAGTGRLTIADGGEVIVGGALSANASSEIVLEGGRLKVNRISELDTLGALDWRSGVLEIGLIDPLNLSAPANLSVSDGATLRMTTGGPSDVLDGASYIRLFHNDSELEVDAGGELISEVSLAILAVANIANRGTVAAQNGSELRIGASVPIGTPTITNHGVMQAVDGGTLSIGEGTSEIVTNAAGGQLTAVNGTLILRGSWTNQGQISVTDSELLLGGSFGTFDMGQISHTNSVTRIIGLWDNSGETFTLNAGTGDFFVGGDIQDPVTGEATTGGTIRGGTIVQDGARLRFTSGNTILNALEGVQIVGDLDMDGSAAWVHLRDETTWSGDAHVAGSSRLIFEQTSFHDDTTINLNGAESSLQIGSGHTLTLGPNATLNLNGPLSAVGHQSAGMLVNQGRVFVNAGNPTTFNRLAAHFTNHGTLTVNSGVTVGLTGTLNNSSGTIQVLDGSQLQLRNVTVHDLGMIQTFGTGHVRLVGAWNNTGKTLILDDTFGPITLDGGQFRGGTIRMEEIDRLRYAGRPGFIDADDDPSAAFENVAFEGDFIIFNPGQAANQQAILRLDPATTWTGVLETRSRTQIRYNAPQVTLDDRNFIFNAFTNLRHLSFDPNSTLTIGPDTTIQANAEGWLLGARAELPVGAERIINRGTIIADGAGSEFSIVTWSHLNRFVNSGTLLARNGASLRARPFSGVDDIVVNEAGAEWGVDGGTIDLRLGFSPSGAGRLLSMPAGTRIFGYGNFIADVAIDGVVEPGLADRPIGTLHFTGPLTLMDNAQILIDLAGNQEDQFDVIDVTGSEMSALALSGTLDVTLIDGFVPTSGDQFDLLEFHMLSGTFAQIDLPMLNHGLYWDTSNLYTTGVLSVVPEPHTFWLAVAGLLGIRRRRRNCVARAPASTRTHKWPQPSQRLPRAQ